MFTRNRMYSRRGASRYSRSRYSRRSTASGFRSRRTMRPRFAMAGYKKNVEKKYHDRALAGMSTGKVSGSNLGLVLHKGVTWTSNGWSTFNFNGNSVGPKAASGDLLKGLVTGTTIETRIGNKINPRYLQGSVTFAAAVLQTTGGLVEEDNQTGEKIPGVDDTVQYIRTTYRMVIVKDLQVNSTDKQIEWNQVFESGVSGQSIYSGDPQDTPEDGNSVTVDGNTAGVHSELSLKNMGRFIVLYDKTFTVDADDPQKTCRFRIRGSTIGQVRYNGPSGESYTDKGIHVIWAAYTSGVPNAIVGPTSPNTSIPAPVMNSRLCFLDS